MPNLWPLPPIRFARPRRARTGQAAACRLAGAALLAVVVAACGTVDNPAANGGPDGTTTGDARIPATTKVLEQDALDELVAMTDGGATLTFAAGSPAGTALAAGDVVVVGLTPVTPDGLLRKVTGIATDDQGRTVVATTAATMVEAIEAGELSVSVAPEELVIEELELAEGVEQVTAAALAPYMGPNFDPQAELNLVNLKLATQVAPGFTVDGGLSVTPGLDFAVSIGFFKISSLEAKASVKEHAGLTAQASAGLSVEAEKEVGSVKFRPIVGAIGPVPVYIRPVLEVAVGAAGELEASLTSSAEQTASYEVGLRYADGGFTPINDNDSNFEYTPPTLGGTLTARPYANASLVFYLYGVVGPAGTGEAFLELTADIEKDPWWQLHAGLLAKFELKTDAISDRLPDFSRDLIELRKLLAEGARPSLTIGGGNLASSGDEGGPFDPVGRTYTLGVMGDGPVEWKAAADAAWLTVAPSSGTLEPGDTVNVTVGVNGNADALDDGSYTGTVSFKNETNDAGNADRTVSLTVRPLPRIEVEPGKDQIYLPAGLEGDTFAPTSKDYTITALDGDMAWEVETDVDWLTVNPVSGTTDEGDATVVTVSVDQGEAALEAADDHGGTITFTNLTNGKGNTTRSATLNALMNVSPRDDFAAGGPEGGDFSDEQTVTLSAVNDAIAYTATSSAGWLTVAPGSGSVAGGNDQDFTLAIGTAAESLGVGVHTATLTLANDNNPLDTVTIDAELTVAEAIAVAPEGTVAFSGDEGGPFSPGDADYTLSAPGGDVDWEASANVGWLDVDPAGGVADPENDATVTVTPNGNADGLDAGDYTATVTFTKTNGTDKTVERTVNLAVGEAPLAASIDGVWDVDCSCGNIYCGELESAMGTTFPTATTIAIAGDPDGFTVTGLPPADASGTATSETFGSADYLSTDIFGGTVGNVEVGMHTSYWWLEDGGDPEVHSISLTWYLDNDSTGNTANWTCSGLKIEN